MKTKILTILAVGGLGVVVACSSSSSGDSATGDGGASGSSGNSSSGASSSSGSSGASSSSSSSSGGNDGGSSGGTVKVGYLSATQTTIVAGPQTIYSTSLVATFAEGSTTGSSGGGGVNPCTVTTEGACKVTECDVTPSDAGVPDAGPPPDGGAHVAANAGALTFKGGKLAAAGVTLTPGANGFYTPVGGNTQMFAGGDSLTVEAVGADVPAFGAKSLQAPGDITLTSPTFDASSKTSFPRDADLNVAWTGGGAGNVIVNVMSIHSGVKTVIVACSFGASGGTGTIPTAALSKLDPPSGTTILGSFSAQPQDSSPFTSGDWNISYVATATGKSGSFTTTN